MAQMPKGRNDFMQVLTARLHDRTTARKCTMLQASGVQPSLKLWMAKQATSDARA
jgi:hypothetical protein